MSGKINSTLPSEPSEPLTLPEECGVSSSTTTFTGMFDNFLFLIPEIILGNTQASDLIDEDLHISDCAQWSDAAKRVVINRKKKLESERKEAKDQSELIEVLEKYITDTDRVVANMIIHIQNLEKKS